MTKHLLVTVLGLLPVIVFAQVSPKELLPIYEGVYVVNLECQINDPTPKCSKLQKNKELVIVGHSKGIGISIVDPQTEKASYVFDTILLDKGGGELSGVNYSVPTPIGEIDLSIDHTENRIRGWLRDPEFSYDIKIYGRQLTSPSVYYSAESTGPDLVIGALEGNYVGSVGGKSGILAIRASATGGMPLATFYHYTGGGRLDFAWAEILPKRRVVNLVNDFSAQGTHLKWTLGFNAGTGTPTLSGLSYSSNQGTYSNLQFTHE